MRYFIFSCPERAKDFFMETKKAYRDQKNPSIVYSDDPDVIKKLRRVATPIPADVIQDSISLYPRPPPEGGDFFVKKIGQALRPYI